jgi:hypothetical protein
VGSGADIDNDGYLDLYVGRYLEPRLNIPTTFYARNGELNQLYRNNGDGTFSNITQAAGVGEVGLCLGSVFGDYDDDGDADLYVVNDFGRKTLYRNEGDGTFTDVTIETGTLAGGLQPHDYTPRSDLTALATAACPEERYGFIGDYIGIVADSHGAWAAWTDLRGLPAGAMSASGTPAPGIATRVFAWCAFTPEWVAGSACRRRSTPHEQSRNRGQQPTPIAVMHAGPTHASRRSNHPYKP